MQEYKLLLKRTDFTPFQTLGELWIWKFEDNLFPNKFFTIEPPIRKDNKEPCCIPESQYIIRWSFMPRHDLFRYELLNVPGFSGIFLHCGNKVSETQGDILIGDGIIRNPVNQQFELVDSQASEKVIELYLAKLDSELLIYH